MSFLERIGGFGWMIVRVFGFLPRIISDRKRILYQLDHVGVNSLPLVFIVGFFSGAIIAWQAAYQFKGLISLSVMGGQALRVTVMEMGPVLTALVIAGRIGASMTAEIGSMKVTEQLDALHTLGLDPVRYIVLPRFLGLTLMMPVLTMLANLVALIGSFVVSNYFLDITAETFFASVQSSFVLGDLLGGLLKSFVFGAVVSLIGCYIGLSTEGGAGGVGKSTIRSFVFNAVSILVIDFLMWLILF